MRRLARAIFLLVLVALWVVVVGAALEAYARYRWHRITESDRFAKTYSDRHGWPGLDNEGPPEEDHTIDPINEEDHLGTLFASLDEQDRVTFARLRDMLIALYDREGNALGVYATPQTFASVGFEPDELEGKPFADTPLHRAGQAGGELLRRVAETAEPETTAFTVARSSGEAYIEMAAFPMRDESGRVTAVACSLRNITGLTLTEEIARSQQARDHPMWKTYFVEYKKNARISWRWYTNNVGFRDDYVALPKPAGVFRIACVGGSTTEEGFTTATTYPNILEKKLQERFPGHAIEVVNCGVVGLSSLGERRRALDFARIEPDLVIRYNAVNDICHALFPSWEFEWERDAAPWQRALLRSWFLRHYWNGLFWPSDQAMAAQLDRSTFDNLGLMHEVLSARGIALALCTFARPDLAHLSAEDRDYYEWDVRTHWQGRHFTFGTYCRLLDLYNRKTEAFCQENELLCIPLAEELKGDGEYFGDICHMRPKGIERKADAVCRHIEGYVAQRLGVEAPPP